MLNQFEMKKEKHDPIKKKIIPTTNREINPVLITRFNSVFLFAVAIPAIALVKGTPIPKSVSAKNQELRQKLAKNHTMPER